MEIFSWLFRSEQGTNRKIYHFSGWLFIFGKSAAGAKVNEFTVTQTTTIYACVSIWVESIAGLLFECQRHIDNKKAPLQK